MKTVEAILDKAFAEGRKSLSEIEVYDIFDSLGLPTPKRVVLPVGSSSGYDAVPGEKLVIKISSSKTLHKTESGGVKICLREQAPEVLKAMSAAFPDAEGIMVSEFVAHPVFALGHELMIGARQDKAFGPIITLGAGGTDAEGLTSRLKPGTSPAIYPCSLSSGDEASFAEFVAGAWIWRYVSGNVRGGKRIADDSEGVKWVKGFHRLVTHFSDNGTSRFAIEEVEVNPVAVSSGRLVALDGVLRFRKSVTGRRAEPTAKGVWSLLKPATVAVAGVSEKKMNMGRIILNNVIKAGFPKDKLWVLKDFAGEIDGVKCCASSKDFPETVDMLVVSIPSGDVPALLKEVASSGKVRGLVLISGGMGEKAGSEGVKDEVMATIAEAKKKNPDFSLSGGNSLGIVSNPSKVNTLFIPENKLVPPLGENANVARSAFISQSGAFVVSMLSKLPGFKPEYCVTVGNQMDVTVPDYVEQVCNDDGIKCVFAYVEGLKDRDGIKLAGAVSAARKKGKQVVVYLAGRTPTGQKAVMGHTASIAGDFVTAKSILSKAGALIAETFDDFEDYVQLCTAFANNPPKGEKLFVFSNAGFESAGMADNILPKGPVVAAPPSKKLNDAIAALIAKYRLDGIVDAKNPLDITPMGPDDAINAISEEVMASGEYDSMIVSMVPLTPAMKTLPSEGFAKSVPAALGALSRKYRMPVIFCVAAGDLYGPYCEEALRNGLAVFRSADRAVRLLSAFMSH